MVQPYQEASAYKVTSPSRVMVMATLSDYIRKLLCVLSTEIRAFLSPVSEGP